MSESFWIGLYRNWIWLAVLVLLAAGAGLWLSIAGVLAVMRKAQLFRIPLAASQEVEFAEAGRVILNIEGPMLSRQFAGARFELRSKDGEPVEGRGIRLRGRSSGLTKARMELMSYDIPRPGRYVLTMTGREINPGHAVVFMRPHGGPMVVRVLGIVLSSVVLIASLVFFLMRVIGLRLGE